MTAMIASILVVSSLFSPQLSEMSQLLPEYSFHSKGESTTQLHANNSVNSAANHTVLHSTSNVSSPKPLACSKISLTTV
jgi:hypothetical protein